MTGAPPADFAGRPWSEVVAVVTGANTGIGRATAQQLAAWGATVILACRSAARAESASEEISTATGNDRVEFLSLDLGDLGSVRSAAAELTSSARPIHLLINNAGVAGQRGRTVDGFELAFGINHLGHFLLTELLVPRLVESAPARIVNVSSGNHFRPRGIDYDVVQRSTPTFVGMREYNVSKLCNVAFTQALARRHDPAVLSAFSVNPGPVASDVWRRMPRPAYQLFQALRRMKSTTDGARPTLRAASEPGLEAHSGAYLDEDSRIIPASPVATEALGEELWRRSEAWVGTAG